MQVIIFEYRLLLNNFFVLNDDSQVQRVCGVRVQKLDRKVKRMKYKEKFRKKEKGEGKRERVCVRER